MKILLIATPWDQLPLLEVNGKKLAQSMTICRYLAKKFKLTGKDDWEEAKCEEYVDALSDLVNGTSNKHHRHRKT